MTDRAVQPEAPTTEAGRQMLDALFADSGRPFLRDVWVANILDIEAEARAASEERPQPDRQQLNDEYMRGYRAASLMLDSLIEVERAGVAQERYNMDFETPDEVTASQERPQPPLHGHQYGGDWVECTDEHPGVAQERPHPCTDCADDAFTGSGRGICAHHEAAAQERPPIDVVRLAKAMALVYVTGHPIHEAVEHWESYRTDATELIAAYGAAEELDD
jgi:hypothetical protein